jgi:hypothetical protein
MSVGLPEEGNITDIFKFGTDRLLMIKERAVYEIKMADSIDPQRTNENVPNVQQRILPVGSEHELVQMILLTSNKLFNETYLPHLDCDVLKEHALEATRELLAMDRIFLRMRGDEENLVGQVKNKVFVNGYVLPYLNDIDQDVKNFLQRADHFTREVFRITRMFEKGFADLDNLLRRAESERPPNGQFIEFLKRASPFLKFVRNARNAVEHPIPQKRIELRNFELTASGEIILPSVEIVHPKTGEPRTGLVRFMHAVNESLANLYGEWVAHLCARKAAAGDFEVSVLRLPEGQRPDKRVSYSYAINIGGEWQPIG